MNFSPAFLSGLQVRKLRFVKSKRAVAQSSVNHVDMMGVSLPVPPVEEQAKVRHMVAAIDVKIYSESSRTDALDGVCQTLPHNVMTGKVRSDRAQFPAREGRSC